MNDRLLAVAMHDVEPRTFDRCIELRGRLREAGVDQVTLLVIPAPRLHPFDTLRPELAEWLRGLVAGGDAVAQHGFRHAAPRRVRGLRARALGGPAAEFAGVGAEEAGHALDAGRRIMRGAGLPPGGFVAPAYCYTPALRRQLANRYSWWADLRRVNRRDGRAVNTGALCLGASTPLKRATSPVVVRAAALAARRIVRLDVHPADAEHPRLLDTIDRLLDRALDRGAEPVTYDGLATVQSSGRSRPIPASDAAAETGSFRVAATEGPTPSAAGAAAEPPPG
jgi:predicted deacetylase